MLQLTIPSRELFDEATQTFLYTTETRLQMEHSLISLSKWESTWCKPFLTQEEKTLDETLDYFRCMTITKGVDSRIYRSLTRDHIRAINDYINAPMTATTFNRRNQRRGSREVVTAEIIYYWMIALNIPMECEKWHLNRLLTLIQVCDIKNEPPKKMGRNAIMRQNSALNAARRQSLHTRG